jgi:hypothetical protein
MGDADMHDRWRRLHFVIAAIGVGRAEVVTGLQCEEIDMLIQVQCDDARRCGLQSILTQPNTSSVVIDRHTYNVPCNTYDGLVTLTTNHLFPASLAATAVSDHQRPCPSTQ